MTDTGTSNDRFNTMSCLLAALKEAQDTVRAYDSKAQIVGVGFIFSIGVITNFGAMIPSEWEIGALGLILGWTLAIGPIVLFGMVLYPSRSIAPALGPRVDAVKHTYYLRGQDRNLDTYLSDIDSCNWKEEFGCEIMKVSGLRDLKRQRFMRALYAAGLSYLVVIVLQVSRLLGMGELSWLYQ